RLLGGEPTLRRARRLVGGLVAAMVGTIAVVDGRLWPGISLAFGYSVPIALGAYTFGTRFGVELSIVCVILRRVCAGHAYGPRRPTATGGRRTSSPTAAGRRRVWCGGRVRSVRGSPDGGGAGRARGARLRCSSSAPGCRWRRPSRRADGAPTRRWSSSAPEPD